MFKRYFAFSRRANILLLLREYVFVQSWGLDSTTLVALLSAPSLIEHMFVVIYSQSQVKDGAKSLARVLE